MKNTKITALSILLLAGSVMSCKDQLDIQNPNQPTPATAASEAGIIALAQGSIYKNGFTSAGNKYYDGVVGANYNGVVGFHELMGDVVGAEAANTYINNLSCPDVVTLDNGASQPNPNNPPLQKTLLRAINTNSQQGGNPGFHEWAYAYQLNNACNTVLEAVDKTTFSGDAAAKKNAVKAWAYFWKGIAYARIGSMYYAGLIVDKASVTNGKYVAKDAIITESNSNFDKAAAAITASGATSGFGEVIGALIPDFFQDNSFGAAPTKDQWLRLINTMKARNILVNTTTATMSSSQWDAVLTLVNNGVKESDPVMAGTTNANGDIFSASNYNVAARAVGSNASGGTYKISERLIQEFYPGDKRLANNFKQYNTWIGNADRGNVFNTRWAIIDKGAGLPGVMAYSNRTAGAGILYLASSYEENELMKAEAKLWKGDVAGAVASINNVRAYQGAGLDPLASTDAAEVKEQLRRERRVALAFRGLSFYDARRWGVLDNGRTDAVVISKDGSYISKKSTIKYGYLDYWDVPDNELANNPAESGSAATKNPK